HLPGQTKRCVGHSSWTAQAKLMLSGVAARALWPWVRRSDELERRSAHAALDRETKSGDLAGDRNETWEVSVK
ncbi:MAG: hypothetical protein RLZZ607_2456, partial [Pseudomonadota bacterium]